MDFYGDFRGILWTFMVILEEFSMELYGILWTKSWRCHAIWMGISGEFTAGAERHRWWNGRDRIENCCLKMCFSPEKTYIFKLEIVITIWLFVT